MADQPKKKPAALRKDNTDRPNRKAFKREGAARNRKNPQSEVQKVLLGDGAYRNIDRPVPGSIPGRWKMRWLASDGA